MGEGNYLKQMLINATQKSTYIEWKLLLKLIDKNSFRKRNDDVHRHIFKASAN